MQKILTQLWRGTLYAGGISTLTWLFFGPIAGFHHMIRCGLLCPIFLDGESPEGGHPMWGEFEVRFSLIRFAISIVLWAICVVFAVRFLRAQMITASVPGTQSIRPSLRFRIGVILGLVLVMSGLASLFVPLFEFAGFVFPMVILVVALVGAFCAVTSIFLERGFNRTIALLCAALSIYALLRYSMFLPMILP